MKNGWQTQMLAKACQIRPPKSEARDRLAPDAEVSFLPMEDMGIDAKFANSKQTKPLSAVEGSYTYFANGDVLLAKITPCFENGKLGIAKGLTNGIGFGSSEYMVFRPNDGLKNEWLYYYLSRETFRSEGAARMSGAVGHKRVSKEFIENYPISFPSLSEQQRIVGILDDAFVGIATAKANTEKNLQNARAIFESYLQFIFTQQGPGWVDVKLGDVCRFQNGFAFKSNKFKESGFPILRISNIQNGEVDTEKLVHFETKDYKEDLNKYRVVEDDLLIAMSGATTGKIGFNKTKEPFYLNQRVGKFVPDKKLNKHFLYYFLSTKIEENLSISAGSAQPNLSTEQIRNINLPLPPANEQFRIVESLNLLHKETRRLQSVYQRKLAALESLKKSLLHQAFTGKL